MACCCHLAPHFLTTCFVDGLAFPSEDVLLFNMTLRVLTYEEKPPWNWTSDCAAARGHVQHATTCGVFGSYRFYRLQAFDIPARFTANRRPTAFSRALDNLYMYMYIYIYICQDTCAERKTDLQRSEERTERQQRQIQVLILRQGVHSQLPVRYSLVEISWHPRP